MTSPVQTWWLWGRKISLINHSSVSDFWLRLPCLALRSTFWRMRYFLPWNPLLPRFCKYTLFGLNPLSETYNISWTIVIVKEFNWPQDLLFHKLSCSQSIICQKGRKLQADYEVVDTYVAEGLSSNFVGFSFNRLRQDSEKNWLVRIQPVIICLYIKMQTQVRFVEKLAQLNAIEQQIDVLLRWMYVWLLIVLFFLRRCRKVENGRYHCIGWFLAERSEDLWKYLDSHKMWKVYSEYNAFCSQKQQYLVRSVKKQDWGITHIQAGSLGEKLQYRNI